MNDCIFCSIAANSDKLVWQNEAVAAFRDISPKAPVHVLVVPKRHVAMLDELGDQVLGGQLLGAVPEIARAVGVTGAYRVQINNGRAAGQVVDHLHLHLLGGATMDPNAHVA